MLAPDVQLSNQPFLAPLAKDNPFSACTLHGAYTSFKIGGILPFLQGLFFISPTCSSHKS
jgi:hypothetical protein